MCHAHTLRHSIFICTAKIFIINTCILPRWRLLANCWCRFVENPFVVRPTPVNATCYNTSTSQWAACSENCGIGISTRSISTTPGCQKQSDIRLCQNHRCINDNKLAPPSSLLSWAAVAAAAASGTGDAGSHDKSSQHYYRNSDNLLIPVHRIRVS